MVESWAAHLLPALPRQVNRLRRWKHVSFCLGAHRCIKVSEWGSINLLWSSVQMGGRQGVNSATSPRRFFSSTFYSIRFHSCRLKISSALLKSWSETWCSLIIWIITFPFFSTCSRKPRSCRMRRYFFWSHQITSQFIMKPPPPSLERHFGRL